jgi:phosphoribosyl 1,2-cyclic phosphodiesterase
MKVSIFASGSSGNCLLLSSGNTNILIDAGISMRRVKTALDELALGFSDINGVLITHEHSDHVSGLSNITKYHQLPIYAPHTIANRLRGRYPEVEPCLRIYSVDAPFAIGSMKITAFHTPHDTDESVGYRVEGDGCFAMATDMGHVTEEIIENLTGADTVLIEANHDVDMLINGPYHVPLKQRILSNRGHLSNENCGKLARYLCQNGTRQIILGHLSEKNNRPELALAAARAAIGELPVLLYCASPNGGLTLNVREIEKCCL